MVGTMFHPNTFRTFARVIKILFMLLLIGFECILRMVEGDASYINGAAFQRARSQILTNAAYVLEYRPQVEHTQAMRDLQTTLPLFEHEEMLLHMNTAPDVQNLLQQADIDYLPIIAAIQSIMMHNQRRIDPQEVNILVLHENNYLIAFNDLMIILPQDYENRNMQLFVLQIVIEVVFLSIFFLAMTTFLWESETYKNENINQKKTPLPRPFFIRRLLICVLVIVLMGLEVVPLEIEKEAAYLNQAGLQRLRCEIVTKSALVLAYRPDGEKTAALSDLQIAVPLFQQEQATLLMNGHAAVSRSAQQATSEYTIMSAAAQALLIQERKAVSLATVSTIITHASKCEAVMNSIVVVLQHQIEQQLDVIFFVEIGIEGTLIIFLGILLLFSHDPFMPRAPMEAVDVMIRKNKEK